MKMLAAIYIFQSQWKPGNVFDCPDNLHLVFETTNIATPLLLAMHLS